MVRIAISVAYTIRYYMYFYSDYSILYSIYSTSVSTSYYENLILKHEGSRNVERLAWGLGTGPGDGYAQCGMGK